MDSFYLLCVFITCDKHTFHYSDKLSLILKDAIEIFSIFSICMPQILMLKLRPVNLYIKVNTHVQVVGNGFT